MAEYISFQPSDHYSTKLYTGTGSSNAITGVGFQPDIVWLKARDYAYNHVLSDAVRGEKQLYPNLPSLQDSNTGEITSFDADGFTVGTAGQTNANTRTFASWNWKMGTTSGISGGTITPSSYSFNTTAGQSIIAYTGTGSNATVPHGLGVAPECIILKRLNSADNWNVGHINNHATTPWDYAMKLNNTSSPTNDASIWNDTAPTTTVFSIGTSSEVNTNTSTYIAYCFASIKGYSKFGSYTGNGNADGTFVYTGFRPAYVLAKNTAGTYNWIVVDNKRSTTGGTNVVDYYLTPNTSDTEGSSGTSRDLDLLSNGFKFRGDGSEFNGSGVNYIYMAFAEFPIVSSNDVPTVAR